MHRVRERRGPTGRRGRVLGTPHVRAELATLYRTASFHVPSFPVTIAKPSAPPPTPDRPLAEPRSKGDLLGELHRIWESATADSISGDLDRATALAARVPPAHREEAARYLAALSRLEIWLHDR